MRAVLKYCKVPPMKASLYSEGNPQEPGPLPPDSDSFLIQLNDEGLITQLDGSRIIILPLQVLGVRGSETEVLAAQDGDVLAIHP